MSLPLPYWKVKTYRKPAVPLNRGQNIKTSNLWEIAAYEKLRKEGWRVFRRGWPDFLAIRGKEIQFIEVKPPTAKSRRPRWLDPEQKHIAAILRRFYGIKVKVWNKYNHFDKQEIKSPPIVGYKPFVRLSLKKKWRNKACYGEHVSAIYAEKQKRKSLTETQPTQG